MSEQNISEKISDAITSIIKKTNIFEKLNNIKGLIQISTGVFIFTTTITIINNYYYIKYLERKNDEHVELIKHTHFKLYKELQTKIDTLLEINIKIQNENNILLQKYDKKYISTLTSVSDFEKYVNTIMLKNNDICDNVDNELLDDCYDILPCDNIKKTTLAGFLSWK